MLYKTQTSVSTNQVLLEQSHPFVYMLYMAASECHRLRAELSSCDRDIMVCKAKYIYYLASYKNVYRPLF